MSAGARLSTGSFAIAWLAALVAMVILDGIWLGLVARGMYQREMGTLMADPVRLAPIVAFYLLFPAALVYLTLWDAPSGWLEVLIRGAVLGLAAYGAYDLTNLAVVRDWPLRISMIDWAWGCVICAAAAGAGYAATWGRG